MAYTGSDDSAEHCIAAPPNECGYRGLVNGRRGLSLHVRRLVEPLLRRLDAVDNDEGNAIEHVETYLRGLFGFIGVTPEFVHADGIAVGPEQRDAGIANGVAEIVALAA